MEAHTGGDRLQVATNNNNVWHITANKGPLGGVWGGGFYAKQFLKSGFGDSVVAFFDFLSAVVVCVFLRACSFSTLASDHWGG